LYVNHSDDDDDELKSTGAKSERSTLRASRFAPPLHKHKPLSGHVVVGVAALCGVFDGVESPGAKVSGMEDPASQPPPPAWTLKLPGRTVF